MRNHHATKIKETAYTSGISVNLSLFFTRQH